MSLLKSHGLANVWYNKCKHACFISASVPILLDGCGITVVTVHVSHDPITYGAKRWYGLEREVLLI